MKISTIFELNKTQAELDFIDIDINEDLPLFLDPFFLSKRNDKWSNEAKLTLKSFFQNVIDKIRSGNLSKASALFNYLHEPNTTCLGLSIGNPRGRGVGNNDAQNIFVNIISSKAIETGLIQDIEDNVLFVDNFGKDKLSDMTTNIITKHLIEYTQNQCKLHGIPLTSNVGSGFYWDRNQNGWNSQLTEMLLIKGKKILLVPKGITSFSKSYTPEKYYNQFVLYFLQNENIMHSSALVLQRADGRPYVTKKSLKARNPQSKEFLRNFTKEHPEVLEDFKKNSNVQSLTNFDICEIDMRSVADVLIARLQSIPTGNENASLFHNTIIGILEFLFYPNLINPVKECEIHEGRKRIDITFENASTNGIFFRLSNNMSIPCGYMFVECKNYSKDIANPELDQLSGRFSTNRGKVGFSVCRTIDNFPLYLQRCRDTFRDGRGLIIPLVDEDLILLLNNFDELDNRFIERFLSDRIREIAIN